MKISPRLKIADKSELFIFLNLWLSLLGLYSYFSKNILDFRAIISP